MEDRISGLSFCLSVSGLLATGGSIVLAGMIIFAFSLQLGTIISSAGLLLLVGSAMIAGATAMSKPEPVVLRQELDWSELKRSSIRRPSIAYVRQAAVWTKTLSKKAVLRLIGRTKEERYVNLATVVVMAVVVLYAVMACRNP